MPRTDNFQKFVKQPKSGAVKEKLRQEKKKEKKERAEAIELHFARKREERLAQKGVPVKSADTRNTNKWLSKAEINRPAAAKKSTTTPSPAAAKKVTPVITQNPAPPAPHSEKAGNTQVSSAPVKAVIPAKPQMPSTSSNMAAGSKPGKEFAIKAGKKSAKADQRSMSTGVAPKDTHQHTPNAPVRVQKPALVNRSEEKITESMPLNKYIAHCGLCSRRDAITLIKQEKVTVNDQLVVEPGTKITEHDTVKVEGKRIIPSRNNVYILLNKPKDYITTSDDPQGRRTVLELVKHATTERVYPVGRLDRNTSGVLLLTNDGELAQKLSHPKHEVKKVYEVRLDRNLTKADFDKLAAGVTLEDGFVAPDVIAYADAQDKSVIGIEIHSGRNRIVRRMFEHLKYDVKGLDRVMYAGLTKKNVQRGKWRFLSEKELRILKFMNQSFIKSKD